MTRLNCTLHTSHPPPNTRIAESVGEYEDRSYLGMGRVATARRGSFGGESRSAALQTCGRHGDNFAGAGLTGLALGRAPDVISARQEP